MALAFVGMLVLRLFGIGLLIGYGRVEEPPLLFKKSQPHVRSFVGWGGFFTTFQPRQSLQYP